MREALCRLLPDLVAALRDVVVVALRFTLFAEVLERVEDALLALLALPAAADRPRDFVLFDLFLLPPRDEVALLDFLRDFLALVAIDALLGLVDEKPSRR